MSEPITPDLGTECRTVLPDLFLSVFMKHLIGKYAGKIDVLETFKRSAESFRNNTFSIHSSAVKLTCRELKLKHSRETINAIFKGGSNV